MKIHHLDCFSMCPFNQALTTREGKGWLTRGRLVAHCLLVETAKGLVLVDTGMGLDDVRDPVRRIGRAMLAIGGPTLAESGCAVRQVEALGYSPRDVTDIVVTHLDLDHAGGLPDFPLAKVHVHGTELDAATARATVMERERYKPYHWAHGPAWERRAATGDRWMGFEAVRALTGRDPEVVMIPLAGHTRGHVAVAVQDGARWLVHGGDAYFHRDEVHGEPAWCPPGLSVFQRMVAIDDGLRRANQARLRELARAHQDVTVFSAHDPTEFDALAAR
jgi:glyoxylase-like metal-dependent hydrolase (beta-lactamase superfamily II)